MADQASLHLPDEIILAILDYLPPGHPSTQKALAQICLVNRSWYDVAIAQLYHNPYITGKNFHLFVRTVCPSINAHIRKSDLAGLVHRLDLSRLVHHSTKSLTARLLGRTKARMESFRAPAASFGLNCFAALGKCENLQTLDLSLVNDAISMHSLANAVKELPRLRRLAFPRSSLREEEFDASSFVFPASLRTLHLSGGITEEFLAQIVKPLGETFGEPCLSLAISHCPHLRARAIMLALEAVEHAVVGLHVSSVPQVLPGELDRVMLLAHLEELSISSSYVNAFTMFMTPLQWENGGNEGPRNRHEWYVALETQASALSLPGPPQTTGIRSLEITSQDRPPDRTQTMVSPWALMMQIKYGNLENLRHVAISNSCGWTHANNARSVQALVDYLDELAEEDEYFEITNVGRRQVGLFSFDP